MDSVLEVFFSLIRLGLGGNAGDEGGDGVADWDEVYRMAATQGVAGVVYAALAKLPAEGRPDSNQVLQWISIAEKIKRRNIQLNALCAEVSRLLEDVGLEPIILKGQALACYYDRLSGQPHNCGLGLLRTPGDIDVYVLPKQPEGFCVHTILTHLGQLKVGRLGRVIYHHVEWSLPEVEVEVHYRPQQLNNPWHNRKLQRWSRGKLQNGFSAPDDEFNLVYLIVHMYHHLLFEGLRLKQVVDYAVLLRVAELSPERRKAVCRLFDDLNICRFASGMMWVMSSCFKVPGDALVGAVDEKEGRMLLEDIFEHKARTDANNMAKKLVNRTSYRLRFLRRYPSEIIWDIPFRCYHFMWRCIIPSKT